MKRFIAMLLVAVMLFSTVPTKSFASDLESDISVITESKDAEDLKNSQLSDEVEEEDKESLKQEDEEDGFEFPELEYEYENDPETVEYHTGKYYMSVGKNAEYAQKYEDFYKLIPESNTYTIRVENDAFFPYQVQFTQNGQSELKWFMTAESQVEFGGYTFSIESKTTREDTISQIGFMINGEYIAAYPQEKSFDKDQIMPASLLPLETTRVKVDLGKKNIYDLKDVQLQTIISGFKKESYPHDPVDVDQYEKVVWIGNGDDGNYKVLDKDNTISLFQRQYWNEVELILGNAKQLDISNRRYILDIDFETSVIKKIDFYTETSQREKVEPLRSDIERRLYNYGNRMVGNTTYVLNRSVRDKNNVFISLELNDQYKNENWKVYLGHFNNLDELKQEFAKDPNIDITDKIFEKNMNELGKGYNLELHRGKALSGLWLVSPDERKVIVYYLEIENELNFEYGFIVYNSESSNSSYNVGDIGEEDGVKIIRPWSEIEPNKHKYLFNISFASNHDQNAADLIEKISAGLFDSKEAAAQSPDIKAQILQNPDNRWSKGYEIQNLEPFDFTVIFKNGTVEKYRLKLITRTEQENDEKPLVKPNGKPTYFEKDYFRVNGYKDSNNSVYAIPERHDDYYNMGYKTLLVLDDSINLNELKPTFDVNEKLYRVYSGLEGSAGTIQISGETVVDFSQGEAQYTATEKNGESLKNYWVNFTKKHIGGAKLFVNAVNGKENPEREIFLTSAQDNKHDIFIANIGDQPLVELNAELIDAKNVELDEYWTIGGENNSTLAAFTTTQKDYNKKNSELPNTAKIRILKMDDGELSGKLKITAKDQQPVVINLKGYAGDPKLTTTDIPKAVKFVPYSAQILHNNKYDWNKVTITKISGTLPAGVELKPNGELYGAPLEIGTYKFRVRMENSHRRFGRSEMTYTLVVEDNTNQNVIDASDENYKIKTFLGTATGNQYDDYIVTSSADQEFTSHGENNEFIDFWLNGQKLVKNTDYTHVDGSTKITIKSQTFRQKAKSGLNTIAAEFRVNGKESNLLKRTAQNFKLNLKNDSNPSVPSKPDLPSTPDSPSKPDSGSELSPGATSPGTSGSSSSSSDSSGSGTTSNVTRNEPKQEKQESLKPQIDTSVVKALEPIVEKINVNLPKESNQFSISKEELKKSLDRALDGRKKLGAEHPIILDFKVEKNDDQKNLVFDLPVESLKQVSDRKNISIRVDLDNLSTLELNPKNIEFLGKQESEKVKFELIRSADKLELKVQAGDKVLEDLGSDVKLSIPKLAQGEVLVLVKTSGEEIILKKSAVVNGDVFAMLKGTGSVRVINNSKEFTDVKDSDWYNDAVKFVSSRELFVGFEDGSFAPSQNMSRAMIATVLHRLEDSPKVEVSKKFADVQDQWYADAVNWASSTNIINGYGNEFGANDSLTREQLSTLVYRYAKNKELQTEVRGDITKFADIDQISAWASDSVRWAVGNGIMVGSQGKLNPEKSITRAEVAQVVKRLIELMVK